MQQDNNPKHTSHSTKEWLKKNKVNVLKWLSQSTDLNPIKMLWKDSSYEDIHQHHRVEVVLPKEWAKTPTCYCAGLINIYKKRYLQLLQQKRVTQILKQRFTPFCNAQICNTGSFFSINTWQRKYFSLTCLIRFSLPTFRIYMKIWWCFGSYLCRNIENSKDFTNF